MKLNEIESEGAGEGVCAESRLDRQEEGAARPGCSWGKLLF